MFGNFGIRGRVSRHAFALDRQHLFIFVTSCTARCIRCSYFLHVAHPCVFSIAVHVNSLLLYLHLFLAISSGNSFDMVSWHDRVCCGTCFGTLYLKSKLNFIAWIIIFYALSNILHRRYYIILVWFYKFFFPFTEFWFNSIKKLFTTHRSLVKVHMKIFISYWILVRVHMKIFIEHCSHKYNKCCAADMPKCAASQVLHFICLYSSFSLPLM